MKSKLLFLPDILLLLFICIACERHELRHNQVGTNVDMVFSTIPENKHLKTEKNNNKMVWETIKDNIAGHLAGFKAKVLED